MTPRLPFRPVLILLVAAGLGACGRVESDPHRFENLAERVAAIPVDGAPAAEGPTARASDDRGLRPALRVEVMEPHALWDARDGGLGGVAQAAGDQVAAAVAPVVVQAVARDARARVVEAVERTPLRPAVRPAEADRLFVQLGAYASEAAAQAAWNRLRTGAAASAMDGLSPVLEPVEIDGRRLVRLKTRVAAARAATLCAAAGVDDPWCRRAA